MSEEEGGLTVGAGEEAGGAALAGATTVEGGAALVVRRIVARGEAAPSGARAETAGDATSVGDAIDGVGATTSVGDVLDGAGAGTGAADAGPAPEGPAGRPSGATGAAASGIEDELEAGLDVFSSPHDGDRGHDHRDGERYEGHGEPSTRAPTQRALERTVGS